MQSKHAKNITKKHAQHCKGWAKKHQSYLSFNDTSGAHHCHRLVVTASNRIAAVAMADALFGPGWVVSAVRLWRGAQP